MGRLLTLKEAEVLMRLKPQTIRRLWILTGKLPARKIGRKWLVDADDVARVLGQLPSPDEPHYDDSGTPLPSPT